MESVKSNRTVTRVHSAWVNVEEGCLCMNCSGLSDFETPQANCHTGRRDVRVGRPGAGFGLLMRTAFRLCPVGSGGLGGPLAHHWRIGTALEGGIAVMRRADQISSARA